MVKLLMRFYDINSGEILIDGHNIQDFNRSDLRKTVRYGTSGYLAVQWNDYGKYPIQ